MTKVVYGERIGRLGKISTGCSAVIFDKDRKKVLLTRRTDNNQWCLPSGRVEPGESVIEACKREVFEETGLKVEIGGLIGIYSNPDRLVEYPDGNKIQLIALCFEAKIISGSLNVNEEVSEFGYFGPEDTDSIDLIPNHRERIVDAFAYKGKPYIR